jgi:hypothetical protein
LGILLVFVSLGGVSLYALNGGAKADNKARRWVGAMHGVGLLLILVGGFGMLARLGVGFPGWVWAKLVVFLLLAGALTLPYRKPELALPVFLALPFIGALAGFLAIFKPF